MRHGRDRRRPTLDPESAEWIRRLSATGRDCDCAKSELHAMLLRFARSQTNRRARTIPVTGPEVDDVAHQAAADALLAITGKLADFRGDSRFTTWAFKFVLLEVSSKLGRHFWRDAGPSLDLDDWDRLPAGSDSTRPRRASGAISWPRCGGRSNRRSASSSGNCSCDRAQPRPARRTGREAGFEP